MLYIPRFHTNKLGFHQEDGGMGYGWNPLQPVISTSRTDTFTYHWESIKVMSEHLQSCRCEMSQKTNEHIPEVIPDVPRFVWDTDETRYKYNPDEAVPLNNTKSPSGSIFGRLDRRKPYRVADNWSVLPPVLDVHAGCLCGTSMPDVYIERLHRTGWLTRTEMRLIRNQSKPVFRKPDQTNKLPCQLECASKPIFSLETKLWMSEHPNETMWLNEATYSNKIVYWNNLAEGSYTGRFITPVYIWHSCRTLTPNGHRTDNVTHHS